MYRLHLTRNLRTLAFLLVIAAVLVGLGSLWWANHTGLPPSWRATIERSISRQGAHVTIGSLSYVPLRGVIARDVHVYSEPQHLREISRLERVLLDFDKTKLARGEFHLNKIQLDSARLDLPVDPTNPASDVLHVSKASGTIFMPGDRRIEVRDARGKIAGIDVILDARIIGYQNDGKNSPEDPNTGKRRELLARVIDELEKWHFDEERPPAIQISMDGDVNDRSSFTAKVELQVKGMEKNGHTLDEVTASADMNGDLLTISSIRAMDARGVFEGHADYNIQSREGRFDISSTLEIPELMTSWMGVPTLREILMGGKQTLEASGEFEVDERGTPSIRMTGHARCESVMLKGVPFDSAEGSFSWKDNSLYIRDILLSRPDGKARGKVMFERPLVRMTLQTTLPVPVYRPFFVGQVLGQVLNDFSEREGAEVNVSLEGVFNTQDRHGWAVSGSGAVKNLNFRGVPTSTANCKFSLNHNELDFHDGTVVFNYSKYGLREAFGGPGEGTAKIGRIRYDSPSKTVTVENVVGSIWAAPLVRLFASKIADGLEVYRFYHPPEMRASGVVDVTPQGRTDLSVSFKSDRPAEYKFLGENLTLQHPSGKVDIKGSRVTVSDLKAETFEGPIAGRFVASANNKLEGELSWTKLEMAGLASTYGFQTKGGGDVTGRIEFAINDGKVETLSGEGLIALEKAELFSVPMFGPLSHLVSTILNDEKAGYQQARNAFCTFKIRNGILNSNDFQTSTRSINFTGEGSVDLRDRTLDMMVRMNARGLLGLVTLPLRPFSGLFQFHGTGPIKNPKWEDMKFSPPPAAQNDILMDPPKARVVREAE